MCNPLFLFKLACRGGGIVLRTRSSAGGRKTGGRPADFRLDATRQSRARLTDLSRHLSLGRMLGARAQSRMSFPNGTGNAESFFLTSTSAEVGGMLCDVEELITGLESTHDMPLPGSRSTLWDALLLEYVSSSLPRIS